MRSLCLALILSASRHILRIRRRRADWRKAFCAQLRATLNRVHIAVLAVLAVAPILGLCVFGGPA